MAQCNLVAEQAIKRDFNSGSSAKTAKLKVDQTSKLSTRSGFLLVIIQTARAFGSYKHLRGLMGHAHHTLLPVSVSNLKFQSQSQSQIPATLAVAGICG